MNRCQWKMEARMQKKGDREVQQKVLSGTGNTTAWSRPELYNNWYYIMQLYVLCLQLLQKLEGGITIVEARTFAKDR